MTIWKRFLYIQFCRCRCHSAKSKIDYFVRYNLSVYLPYSIQLYNTSCAAAMHRYCHSAHFIRSNSQLIFLFGLWNLVSDPAPKLSIRFHLVLGHCSNWNCIESGGVLHSLVWVFCVSVSVCVACYCLVPIMYLLLYVCCFDFIDRIDTLMPKTWATQIWCFFSHFFPVFSLCRGLQGFEFNSIHFYSIVDMHIGYIERGKMRTESAHTSVNK